MEGISSQKSRPVNILSYVSVSNSSSHRASHALIERKALSSRGVPLKSGKLGFVSQTGKSLCA